MLDALAEVIATADDLLFVAYFFHGEERITAANNCMPDCVLQNPDSDEGFGSECATPGERVSA